MSLARLGVGALFPVALVGCTVGPNYRRPGLTRGSGDCLNVLESPRALDLPGDLVQSEAAVSPNVVAVLRHSEGDSQRQ